MAEKSIKAGCMLSLLFQRGRAFDSNLLLFRFAFCYCFQLRESDHAERRGIFHLTEDKTVCLLTQRKQSKTPKIWFVCGSAWMLTNTQIWSLILMCTIIKSSKECVLREIVKLRFFAVMSQSFSFSSKHNQPVYVQSAECSLLSGTSCG